MTPKLFFSAPAIASLTLRCANSYANRRAATASLTLIRVYYHPNAAPAPPPLDRASPLLSYDVTNAFVFLYFEKQFLIFECDFYKG